MQIFYNANIHTLNLTKPQATAIVIDNINGKVFAVGEDEEILAEFDGNHTREDMQGKTILPGLCDSHIHFRMYSQGLNQLKLYKIEKDEILAKVAEAVKKTPPGNWILGQGWNQDNWEDNRFPTAADLDAIAPKHPIYLIANSYHAAWANSLALKAAKITQQTPNPVNGEFGRDENGNPDGMIYESAMTLVKQAIPTPTLSENAEYMKAGQLTLWEMGITSIHDFDRINSFQALQSLHQNQQLNLRVLKHLPVEKLDYIIETGLRSGFGDDILRIGGIKVFADGALGPRTAAMLDPYNGEPNNQGMLFLDGEEFFEHGRKAVQNGLNMTVHAIGDKANHEMLKGYDQLRKYEKANNLHHYRHRIEHAQILHPDDFSKLKQLDIIASVQPIHATSDFLMADNYWGERAQNSYAWRTLLDHGIKLTFGSDAPVDSANPFHGIHAAVTRQRNDGTPNPEGWNPSQKLTLEESIAGYTTGPAFTSGMEDRLGKLAPGFYADLIAIDQDPYTIEPEDLFNISPVKTMVNGKWVWQK